MPLPVELEAARGTSLPDVITDDLAVLFCGINPGLWSAATGHHFARPGNRFWPALRAAGFTPRLLGPADQADLLALGLGITNIVSRATARADELTAGELESGRHQLAGKVRQHRPAWLAVLGVTAYRTAFQSPGAAVGGQAPAIGDTRVWVLPNPSGLNAHYPPDALAKAFRRFRDAVGRSALATRTSTLAREG